MAEIYEKRGRRYIRRPELDPLAVLDFEYMIMSTVDRALGSRTIAAMTFVQDLERHWEAIPVRVRDYIQRVVEERFVIDDEKRAAGLMEFLPLGMDCDRREWEKLRARWRVPG